MKNPFTALWTLWRDGLRNTSLGRPLIWLVILKLVILFAILRVFFFKPAMSGMTDQQKSEKVGDRLTESVNDTETITITN